jgi:hypothetical protein
MRAQRTRSRFATYGKLSCCSRRSPRAGSGTPARWRSSLQLGGSLVAAQGYAHVEVEAAFERVRALSETLGDPHRLGVALDGLAMFSHSSGQVERACVLSGRALTIAERSGDRELALVATG